MDHQGLNLRNPLFEELARYPGRFAQPVFFANPDGQGHHAFKSGSGFFMRVGERLLAVTCQHVLADYRKRRAAGHSRFQFALVPFDPEECLVAESEPLDLATFDVKHLSDAGVIPESSVVAAKQWPPGPLADDDVLALAGFPGIGREQITADYFRFHLLSSGTTEIAALHPTYLYTRMESEQCVSSGVRPDVVDDLGGTSGGPVFVWRKGVIVTAELVGIIIEYQAGLDLLYVRRATCIRADGTLVDEG